MLTGATGTRKRACPQVCLTPKASPIGDLRITCGNEPSRETTLRIKDITKFIDDAISEFELGREAL